MGLIQGGDPLSKDPAKRAMYGTGGLGMLAQEFNREPVTRGAVAAVLQPGKPDSAGSQFFIAVTDQLALNGSHGLWTGRRGPRGGAADLRGAGGREGEGDRSHRDRCRSPSATRRRRSRRRSRPKPSRIWPIPRGARDHRGAITIAFDPAKAPEHVRNFLRLASAGSTTAPASIAWSRALSSRRAWCPRARHR